MNEVLHDYLLSVITECCGSVETVFPFVQRTSDTGYSSFKTDQVYIEIIINQMGFRMAQIVCRRIRDQLPDYYTQRVIDITSELFSDHEQVLARLAYALLGLKVCIKQDVYRRLRGVYESVVSSG
jgi:hypothetical protein